MKHPLVVVVVLLLWTAIGHTAVFPESWEGTWVGKVTGVSPEIEMQLVISPIDSEHWHWRIRYGQESERPYQLQVVDRRRGHFLIDEQNGILIDHFFLDGHLTSSFTVNGKLVVFGYEMTPNGISIVAPSFELSNSRVSTGAGAQVCAFALGSIQRAVLNRVAP